MNFDLVVTVEKETSKEEFLRKLLIELASSFKTPVEVVKAKFGEVEESVREAIVCSSHIEMDYSASIGYDRQETYWTKEKKYNSSTKEYYYVDIQKTRTVTDWQPFCGHISGDKTAAAFNEPHSGIYDNDVIADVIKSTNDNSKIVMGDAVVDYAGLEAAKKNCEFFLEMDIRYPGDHHKDTTTYSNVTVEGITCYKLPYYTVEFIYNDKKYTASGFASGNPNIKTEFPSSDLNVEEQVKEATEKMQKLTSRLWIAFGVTFIFACIMCYFGAPWLCILPVGALVAAIYFNKKYFDEYNEKIKSLTTDIALAKMLALEDVLKSCSYEQLSEQENDNICSKLVSGNIDYQASHSKPSIKTRATWTIIITAILTVTCLVNGIRQVDATRHSPKQLDIEIVSKSEEYQPYVSKYTNGCYYIYFNLDISAKKLGVTDMTLITHIYDKNTGEELGYLTTSFSGMNLNAGDTKGYLITWEDNQPQKNNNTFFLTIYNMDYEDLEFKFEYDYIHFDDGKYYHGDRNKI